MNLCPNCGQPAGYYEHGRGHAQHKQRTFCSTRCKTRWRARKNKPEPGPLAQIPPLNTYEVLTAQRFCRQTPKELVAELAGLTFAELDTCWVAILTEAREDGASLRDLAMAMVEVRQRYRDEVAKARLWAVNRAAG